MEFSILGEKAMVMVIIEDNFVPVVITSFLILFILTNNNFEKRTNQLFLMAACIILVVIVEEAWEAYLAESPTYMPMRVPLSALGYTLRPIVPLVAMLMVRKFDKRKTIIMVIPLIFNTLVSFSAFFCKLAFSYNAENEFVRGPLGYTPFIVSAIYVVGVIYFTIKTYRDMGMAELMIVSAIVLLAFIATILESMFHFQFIQCAGMATSLTFYYMFLHSNQNNRDPLTGALTRRRYYLDTNRHYTSLSALISIDLNDLKSLNDRQGHMEGDKALATVGRIIKRCTGTHTGVYRVGGDEFMILCYKLNEEKVRGIVHAIESEMERTDYRCAIGYAMRDGHEDFESMCRTADSLMYEKKRQMKEKR